MIMLIKRCWDMDVVPGACACEEATFVRRAEVRPLMVPAELRLIGWVRCGEGLWVEAVWGNYGLC